MNRGEAHKPERIALQRQFSVTSELPTLPAKLLDLIDLRALTRELRSGQFGR